MSSEASRRSVVGIILCTLLLLIQAAFWVAVFYVLYFYIPRFKDVANDFGMELSEAEILLVRMSDWFVNYLYLGLPLLLAGLALTTTAAARFYGALVPSGADAESPARSA